MLLPVIERNQLPPELRKKPQPDEIVHHFAYIANGGGCASQNSSKQWILVTNRRILFEASVKETTNTSVSKFTHQSGSIPIAKVSYVGTATIQEQQGCSEASLTSLRINSGGGEIVLAVPTKREAERTREVIDGIISQAK